MVLVVQRVQRRLECQQVAVPQVVGVRQAPLPPAVRVAPVVALPARQRQKLVRSVWCMLQMAHHDQDDVLTLLAHWNTASTVVVHLVMSVQLTAPRSTVSQLLGDAGAGSRKWRSFRLETARDVRILRIFNTS